MRPCTIEQRQRLYLQARRTIAREYRRPLTQVALARALSSSPRQLSRVYAQFGELTFHQDLLTHRLTVGARLLLERPSMPVREVAQLVGFRQPQHFARAFRRRYGLTPMRFRAHVRAHARGKAVSSSGSSSTGPAPGKRRRIRVPPPGAE